MYKYFLGIDISKDSFDFSFTDETEKVLYKDHYQMDMTDAKDAHIKSIVNQVFPEMLKNTNIFLKSSLNLLLQAPSKRIIRNLKEKKIANYIELGNINNFATYKHLTAFIGTDPTRIIFI
ncbi:MAG: hypothetical protein Q9M43_13155 [Sulfurimonas sp.]|nr:hypothetical protein [Sulfurimonas sp.]